MQCGVLDLEAGLEKGLLPVMRGEDSRVGLVAALLIFTLSFLTPAARRWGGKCREADLACWVAARSGAFPFRRMVAKCILKKMVVGAILLVCLGSFAYTPESIGLMCDRLKDRYVELMSGGCR